MSGPVVVLAGEPEYLAHQTMPAVAELIATELGVDAVMRTPSVIEDEPTFPTGTFGDLDVLAQASLLVVYTRWRVLGDEDMTALQAYLDRRAPVIGLRTSTHAFRFPAASRWAGYNDFGRDVLGSPWVSHHGHSSSTEVEVVPDAPSALVAELPARFPVRSWLYRTELADWARPVLNGSPVAPESAAVPGPVAWCGVPEGRPTFTTTLGHPDDLLTAPVRQLLLNAARWSLR